MSARWRQAVNLRLAHIRLVGKSACDASIFRVIIADNAAAAEVGARRIGHEFW